VLSLDDAKEEESAFDLEGGAVIVEVDFEWVENAEVEKEVSDQRGMMLGTIF